MLTNLLSGLLQMAPLRVWDGQIPLLLQTEVNPIIVPPAASGGAAIGSIELPGDCYIRFDQWRAYWANASTSSATYPTTSNLRCSIWWASREWSLMNGQSAPRMELIFGTAQRPAHFSNQPWIVASPGGGRGVLTFEFTNLETTSITVELAIVGVRTKSLNLAAGNPNGPGR